MKKVRDKIIDGFYWIASAVFDALFHWKLIKPYDGPKPDMVGQYEKGNGLEPDPPYYFADYTSAVCSRLHRCFPPLPTICAICGRESGTGCPLNIKQRERVPIG